MLYKKVEKTGDFWHDYNNIDEAIKYAWRNLLNFEHPLFGTLPGPENCRIDALPLLFLSGAMEEKKDSQGRSVPVADIYRMPKEKLPKIVSALREACTSRQVKKIRALFSRINKENQLNRTRKRDRRIWIHDILFEKWSRDNDWAIVMKAICEQFNILLPPEFQDEWDMIVK